MPYSKINYIDVLLFESFELFQFLWELNAPPLICFQLFRVLEKYLMFLGESMHMLSRLISPFLLIEKIYLSSEDGLAFFTFNDALPLSLSFFLTLGVLSTCYKGLEIWLQADFCFCVLLCAFEHFNLDRNWVIASKNVLWKGNDSFCFRGWFTSTYNFA